MRPAARALGWCLAALLGAGCTGKVLAPVGRDQAPRDQKRLHVVQRGETLYAIAWRYGVDYRALAAWNALGDPYTVRPGERLRIRPPPAARSVPAPPAPRSAPAPAVPQPAEAGGAPPLPAPASKARGPSPVEPARKPQPTAPAPRAAGTDRAGPETERGWRWPARGRLVGRFRRSGRKGIDIGGRGGTPIVAARAGRVVYSGGGLIGYGKLIILKHDERYLSAYAHNDKLYVREGDTVRAGQRIAVMGRTGSDRVKLHFEIRRDGKPVDPLRYLPR